MSQLLLVGHRLHHGLRVHAHAAHAGEGLVNANERLIIGTCSRNVDGKFAVALAEVAFEALGLLHTVVVIGARLTVGVSATRELIK